MKHVELVEIGYRWVLKRYPVAYKEIRSMNTEVPDIIGFRSEESIVIEVKVSRSDFLRDCKKEHRKQKGMGKFRFFLCPENLLLVGELPHNWGLIYVDKKGRCRVEHNPYNPFGGNIWGNGFDRDVEAENRLMFSVLRRVFKR